MRGRHRLRRAPCATVLPTHRPSAVTLPTASGVGLAAWGPLCRTLPTSMQPGPSDAPSSHALESPPGSLSSVASRAAGRPSLARHEQGATGQQGNRAGLDEERGPGCGLARDREEPMGRLEEGDDCPSPAPPLPSPACAGNIAGPAGPLPSAPATGAREGIQDGSILAPQPRSERLCLQPGILLVLAPARRTLRKQDHLSPLSLRPLSLQSSLAPIPGVSCSRPFPQCPPFPPALLAPAPAPATAPPRRASPFPGTASAPVPSQEWDPLLPLFSLSLLLSLPLPSQEWDPLLLLFLSFFLLSLPLAPRRRGSHRMASSKPMQLSHSPSAITLLTLPKFPLRSPSLAAPNLPAQLSWPMAGPPEGAMPLQPPTTTEPHFLTLSAVPTASRVQRLPALEQLSCAQQQQRPLLVQGAPQRSCAASQPPVLQSLGLPPLQQSSSRTNLADARGEQLRLPLPLPHPHAPRRQPLPLPHLIPPAAPPPLLTTGAAGEEPGQQWAHPASAPGCLCPLRSSGSGTQGGACSGAQGGACSGAQGIAASTEPIRGRRQERPVHGLPPLHSAPALAAPLQHSTSQTHSTGSACRPYTPTAVMHAHMAPGSGSQHPPAAFAHQPPQQQQQQPGQQQQQPPFSSTLPSPRLLQQPLLSHISARQQHQPSQPLPAAGPLPASWGCPCSRRGEGARPRAKLPGGPTGISWLPRLVLRGRRKPLWLLPRAPACHSSTPSWRSSTPSRAPPHIEPGSEGLEGPRVLPCCQLSRGVSHGGRGCQRRQRSRPPGRPPKKGAPASPPRCAWPWARACASCGPATARWHKAQVKKFDPKKALHTVFTDHGDSRRVDLRVCRWEPLSGRTQGRPSCSRGCRTRASRVGGGLGVGGGGDDGPGGEGRGEEESAAGEEDPETGRGEGGSWAAEASPRRHGSGPPGICRPCTRPFPLALQQLCQCRRARVPWQPPCTGDAPSHPWLCCHWPRGLGRGAR